MIVAIKRRHRGISDDVEDALAGDDGSTVTSTSATQSSSPTGIFTTPYAPGATAVGPYAPVGGNGSSSSSSSSSIWGDLLKSVTQGFTAGLKTPTSVVKPPASSTNTALIVGVGAVALVGVVLLMRGRSSAA